MALTFLNLQDAVISDRFDASQRGDVKNALNHVHGRICDSEEWTFKHRTSLVTVTAGSATVTVLPASLGVVTDLIRADGTPLRFLAPDEYEDAYYGETATGPPEDYTVDNGTVKVGPISSETSAVYELVDEREPTEMSADADEPIVPNQHRLILVLAAAIFMLKLAGDPTAAGLEGEYNAAYTAMRRRYLTNARSPGRALGRDPLADYC